MNYPTDIAKHYGAGVKKDAIRMHFQRDIAPHVKAAAAAVAQGEDPHQLLQISEPGGKCQNDLQPSSSKHSTISFT